MKTMKRYLWGVSLVVVALFALSSLSRPAPQGAIAQQSQSNAPEALEEVAKDPPPPCVGPYVSSRALAQIIATGSPSVSVRCNSGFSTITHPFTGIYCLTLSSTTSNPITALVTVEWGNSLGVVLFPQWNRFNTSCGGSVQSVIEVRTYKGDIGGVGSGYKIPVLSDQVAFTALVP